MPLPYSFLAGLFCLYGAPLLVPYLPRDVAFATVAPWLPLVIVPWFVSRVLSVRVPRPDSHGARLRIRVNHLVQSASVPGCFLALLVFGEYSDWVDEWVRQSMFASTLVNVLPLVAMEIGVNLARRQSARQLQYLEAVIGPSPFHLTLVFFLLALVLLFALASDVVALQRDVEVFFVSTSVGNLIWIFLLAAVLCVVLPGLFRLLMRGRPAVPEDARAIAANLGFKSSRVQLLETDERLVNAMLVGPVPGFRYLFLTDGLVRLLDPISLRGVVAHEVGHARANHPMWLILTFVVVPLLLFHPLDVFGVFELDETVQIVSLGLLVILGIKTLRRVAHLFELEADLISANALGGSAPCILALHKVSQLFGFRSNKDSMRHPSEDRRILHLLSCEGDPWFRERFERRGRVVRKRIVGAALMALALAVWAQFELMPVDRVLQAFYTGRFADAEVALNALPEELPPGRDRLVAELREEVAAARQLVGAGGRWHDIRDDLGTRALQRAHAELLRNGPKTARRWFGLGLVRRDVSKLDLSLFLYCSAMADGDETRAAGLRDHVLATFGIEAELREALEAADRGDQ